MKTANEMMRADSLSTHSWLVSWYNSSLPRSQNLETFDAWVSPAGRILGFNHIIADTATKLSLSAEEAQQRAQRFLETQGVRFNELHLKTSV